MPINGEKMKGEAEQLTYEEMQDFFERTLKLITPPVAVKFVMRGEEKPSGLARNIKPITFCQGVPNLSPCHYGPLFDGCTGAGVDGYQRSAGLQIVALQPAVRPCPIGFRDSEAHRAQFPPAAKFRRRCQQGAVLLDLVAFGAIGQRFGQEGARLGPVVADAAGDAGRRCQPGAPPVIEAQYDGRVVVLSS